MVCLLYISMPFNKPQVKEEDTFSHQGDAFLSGVLFIASGVRTLLYHMKNCANEVRTLLYHMKNCANESVEFDS